TLMESVPVGTDSPSPAVSAFPPFRLPQLGRRSWNPFPSERIPLPCPSCVPSVCAAAIRATLMESVPVERIPLSLPFVHSLRLCCRSSGDAHGIRSRRNGFPFPALRAFPPFRLPQSGQPTTGKTVPKDGLFHERTLCAEYFARCGERLFFCFD
ncbi:hypothetical protein HMPREF1526_02771, partial [Butyricicoccus pullicaecorum 1.2]